VVADDHGDDERHRGVEPVPAAGGQDDPAGGRDAGRRGGVGDGVEQDRGDGQVTPVSSIVIIGVGPEHEGADGHGQRGYAAHHEYRQAVHLRGTGAEGFCGYTNEPLTRIAGCGEVHHGPFGTYFPVIPDG
jgi:hypothetical protein